MSEPTRRLTLGVVLSLGLVCCLAATTDLGPALLLLAGMAFAGAIVLSRKYRMAPLAGLLFIGSFKPAAATAITAKDPTMVFLGLLAISLVVEVLFRLSGRGNFSIARAFAGQGFGLVAYLAFFAIMVLSYLYTPAGFSGGIKLARFVFISAPLFVAPFLLLNEEKDLNQFVVISLILSLVLAFRAVWEIVKGVDLQVILSGNGDITRIGDAQLIGAMIIILLYYRFTERFKRVIVMFCIPVLIVGLIACASRGPIFSLGFALVASLFVLPRGFSVVPRKVVLAAMVVLAVLAVFALVWIEKFPAAQSKFMQKELEITRLSSLQDPGGTAGERLKFYRRAIEGFREKPLLGWGMGSWVTYYYGYDDTSRTNQGELPFQTEYPHNFILEVAIEQGAAGLIALGLLFWAIFKRLHHLRTAGAGRYAFLFPMILFHFSAGMFSQNINSRELWFWCGLVFAASRLVDYSLEKHAVARRYRSRTAGIPDAIGLAARP